MIEYIWMDMSSVERLMFYLAFLSAGFVITLLIGKAIDGIFSLFKKGDQ